MAAIIVMIAIMHGIHNIVKDMYSDKCNISPKFDMEWEMRGPFT